jgi:hypothetical protein
MTLARQKLSSSRRHTPEEISKATRQLRALQFSFEIGNLDVDLLDMTAPGLLALVDEIAALSFDELRKTRNFERDYEGGDEQQWANYARWQRISLLLRNYELLVRLRSDEPEAWDEVNELFFDD